MWLDNIVTSDACYFTFDPHSSDGNLVDLSHLPDGFGIFRLPYRDAQEEGWPRTISVLDYEALDMVYPLDPEAYLFSMHTDAEETQLILHTLENDRYMLTVIDLDTMATLQKLDLTARPQYFGEPVVGEDFIITAMYTEDQRQALVLARTAEGLYEMAYLCPLEHDDLSSATVVSEAMSFDGERLAVAGFLRVKREGYASVETCDYSLAVYDKSGLLYCAEFDSSLDSGYNEKRYEFFCMPFGYPPIQLEWDKS